MYKILSYKGTNKLTRITQHIVSSDHNATTRSDKRCSARPSGENRRQNSVIPVEHKALPLNLWRNMRRLFTGCALCSTDYKFFSTSMSERVSNEYASTDAWPLETPPRDAAANPPAADPSLNAWHGMAAFAQMGEFRAWL